MDSLKRFLEFAKNNKWVLVVLGLVASFAAGFFIRPERVEVKTEYVDKVRYKEREESDKEKKEKIKYVTKEAEEKIKYVRVEVKPDGTRIEETTEKSKRDASSETETARLETEKTIRDLTLERDTLKRKTETPVLPSFMVGVGVGYDRSPAWLRIPSAQNLSIGLEVKARIPKTPLWLGGAVYSTGLVAGTVSVSF